MIVITSAIALDAVETGPDHPLIGWHNIVTTANIATDANAANYPGSNLANPSTAREWHADHPIECHVTVTTDGVTQLDYLAVAKHNFGSGRMPVSVEGYSGGVWTELTSPVFLPDDRPVLFRWSPQAIAQVRLRIQAAVDGVTMARAAVVYVGKLLIMQRRLYVNYTPLPLGRKTSVSNGKSESGNFLGRVVLGSWRESTASFRLLGPAWYREKMDPFVAVAQATPFFFAWRPSSYPNETGYAVLTDDPVPAPEASDGGNLLAVSLAMRGVA